MVVISRNSSQRPEESKDTQFFLNRMMSKYMAAPNPSFRVYYGGTPASVPFTWESAPGTPKHHRFSSSSSDDLPPLTPPPSFHSYSNDYSHHRRRFRSSAALKLPNFLFFRALFPAAGLRSGATSSRSDQNYISNCSLSYSSSSSGRSPATTADVCRKKSWPSRCFSCSRVTSHHHHRHDDDGLEEGR